MILCVKFSKFKWKDLVDPYQINPYEFEEASFPDQHQFPEPLTSFTGSVIAICINVSERRIHFSFVGCRSDVSSKSFVCVDL